MYATRDLAVPLDCTLVLLIVSHDLISNRETNRLGVELIATLISAVLYGVMLMQAFHYFTCEYRMVALIIVFISFQCIRRIFFT